VVTKCASASKSQAIRRGEGEGVRFSARFTLERGEGCEGGEGGRKKKKMGSKKVLARRKQFAEQVKKHVSLTDGNGSGKDMTEKNGTSLKGDYSGKRVDEAKELRVG